MEVAASLSRISSYLVYKKGYYLFTESIDGVDSNFF